MLIDGTPIPTGNRAGTGTTNYVAKHHRKALCVQVAAFRDGTLADVSAPVPGSRRRSRADREHNRHIASLRAPVERTIGLLKHWKILATGYRGRLTELPSLIHIIVNLEFYRQAA